MATWMTGSPNLWQTNPQQKIMENKQMCENLSGFCCSKSFLGRFYENKDPWISQPRFYTRKTWKWQKRQGGIPRTSWGGRTNLTNLALLILRALLFRQGIPISPWKHLKFGGFPQNGDAHHWPEKLLQVSASCIVLHLASFPSASHGLLSKLGAFPKALHVAQWHILGRTHVGNQMVQTLR